VDGERCRTRQAAVDEMEGGVQGRGRTVDE